jgi:hypothetical protein
MVNTQNCEVRLTLAPMANAVTMVTIESIVIIIIIMALQPFLGPWPLFQFLDPIHSR